MTCVYFLFPFFASQGDRPRAVIGRTTPRVLSGGQPCVGMQSRCHNSPRASSEDSNNSQGIPPEWVRS